MMNKTKTLLLAAIALIVVGGPGGWVALSSSGNSIDVSGIKTVEQDFSSIKINADNVGVEIQATEKETATIEMMGQTHKSVPYSFDADVVGDTLIVSANMGVPLSWVNLYPNNLKIVVSLPQRQYQSLWAQGDSGMIHLSDLQIDVIDCNAESSSITLEKITSMAITLESDAHIGLTNVVSDSVIVVSSASIDLERVEADEITAKTAARILLSTSHIDRHINLDAGTGSIQVKTDNAPENVRFEVSSNSSINLLGGRYDGGVSAGDGKYLVRLAAAGSITVEEVSR